MATSDKLENLAKGYMEKQETSNVVKFPDPPVGYEAQIISAIGALTQMKLRKEKIVVTDILKWLDPNEDNSAIIDWLADNDVISKAAFERLVARKIVDDRIFQMLGFVPKNPTEYITKFTEKNKISVTFSHTLIDKRPVKLGDTAITDEDRLASLDIDRVACIHESSATNIATLLLELRNIRSDVGLPFKDTEIDDALTMWENKKILDRRIEIFMDMRFEKGRATGPEGKAEWDRFEKVAFKTTATHPDCEIAPGFPTAIIKKFMWQVKRKALGKEVTNHLMPVIVGAQGMGKSVMVKMMLAGWLEATKEIDFGTLMDDRNIDIFDHPVLFFDEMAGAKKAEMSEAKHILTASTVTRRIMRSNRTLNVVQRSTLIGCANHTLESLIRDETGMRRFAELPYTDMPNWEVLNTVDWMMLWRSVDEYGADPMSPEHAASLKAQQANNEYQTPYERWLIAESASLNGRFTAEALFIKFTDWRKDLYPELKTDVDVFRKALRILVDDNASYKYIKYVRGNKNMVFVF